MSSKPTLARVAVIRGDFALMSFKNVVATKGTDLQALRMHSRALDNLHATVRATYAAEALGDALKRGIEDPVYRAKIVNACFQRFDELPDATG